MLHMGYVDEVLFGKEVVDRIPILVREWVKVARDRDRAKEIAGSGDEPKPQGHIGSTKSISE
jgi:hypothetical protein